MIADWTAGTPIAAPVYLDANVVIAYLVHGHQHYVKAASLMADLMTAGSPILLSDLGIIESTWGLTNVALRELKRWPPSKRFDPTAFRRDRHELFEKRGATVGSFAQWLEQLGAAGYPIDVVHTSRMDWPSKSALMISYMRAFGLLGNDAAHLSIATGNAKSFVTCDLGFEVVAGADAPAGLEVVLIRPDTAAGPPAATRVDRRATRQRDRRSGPRSSRQR